MIYLIQNKASEVLINFTCFVDIYYTLRVYQNRIYVLGYQSGTSNVIYHSFLNLKIGQLTVYKASEVLINFTCFVNIYYTLRVYQNRIYVLGYQSGTSNVIYHSFLNLKIGQLTVML